MGAVRIENSRNGRRGSIVDEATEEAPGLLYPKVGPVVSSRVPTVDDRTFGCAPRILDAGEVQRRSAFALGPVDEVVAKPLSVQGLIPFAECNPRRGVADTVIRIEVDHASTSREGADICSSAPEHPAEGAPSTETQRKDLCFGDAQVRLRVRENSFKVLKF